MTEQTTQTILDEAASTVDQIPLGSQLVDWTGLDATSRPRRSPSYPDDVLPTTSVVQGMYQQAAQVITTDGENALRVYVVNQSGGGSTVPTAPYKASTGTGWYLTDGTDQTGAGNASTGYVGAFSFAATVIANLQVHTAAVADLFLSDPNTGKLAALGSIACGALNQGFSQIVTFPIAMDLHAMGLTSALLDTYLTVNGGDMVGYFRINFITP